MNKINRKVEYALMALKFMSSKYAGERTTAKEVCDATGCPFDGTARVMQVMAQKKLLKSEQGIHGGYLIIRDLSKVSFYELIEMILGPVGIVKCIQGSHECELLGHCNIQSPLNTLNQKLIEFYRGLSLKELLGLRESTARQGQEAPREARL